MNTPIGFLTAKDCSKNARLMASSSCLAEGPMVERWLQRFLWARWSKSLPGGQDSWCSQGKCGATETMVMQQLATTQSIDQDGRQVHFHSLLTRGEMVKKSHAFVSTTVIQKSFFKHNNIRAVYHALTLLLMGACQFAPPSTIKPSHARSLRRDRERILDAIGWGRLGGRENSLGREKLRLFGP